MSRCEICEKDISMSNKSRHMKNCRGVTEPKAQIYACDDCTFTASKKYNLDKQNDFKEQQSMA